MGHLQRSNASNDLLAASERQQSSSDATIYEPDSLTPLEPMNRNATSTNHREPVANHFPLLEQTRLLRKKLKKEQERLQHDLVGREHELNEAAIAVDRVARCLESQRLLFARQHKKLLNDAQRRQRRLEARMNSVEAAVQRQEEAISAIEQRLVGWLAQPTNWPHDMQPHSVPDNDSTARNGQPSENTVVDHRDGYETGDPLAQSKDCISQREVSTSIAAEAMAITPSQRHTHTMNDHERTKADRLSYEVCDRLVQQRRNRDLMRIRRIISLLIVFSVAGGVIYLFWHLNLLF